MQANKDNGTSKTTTAPVTYAEDGMNFDDNGELVTYFNPEDGERYRDPDFVYLASLDCEDYAGVSLADNYHTPALAAFETDRSLKSISGALRFMARTIAEPTSVLKSLVEAVQALNATAMSAVLVQGQTRDAVEAIANRYHGNWVPERMRAVAVPFDDWRGLDEIERERIKVDAKAQGRDVRIIPSVPAMSPEDFEAQTKYVA